MNARFVKDVSEKFAGTAHLYQLQNGSFIVASATVVPFSGPETYLFRADEEGNVTNWSELPGSRKDTLNILQTVAEAPEVE